MHMGIVKKGLLEPLTGCATLTIRIWANLTLMGVIFNESSLFYGFIRQILGVFAVYMNIHLAPFWREYQAPLFRGGN